MAYVPYQGGTLLIPFDEKPHLFVTMNAPCVDGLCLLIMVTSIKSNRIYDAACVLQPGEHDFILKPSYLLYRRATQSLATHITNMVARSLYIPKQDVKQLVFQKIVAGLFASDDTAPTMLKYARSVGL